MKTLIVNAESELFFKEVPMPTITTKQALVKMLACGILWYGRHNYKGRI
ncbi:hypothetical protein [Lysinibacillus sp. NPDC056232]